VQAILALFVKNICLPMTYQSYIINIKEGSKNAAKFGKCYSLFSKKILYMITPSYIFKNPSASALGMSVNFCGSK